MVKRNIAIAIIIIVLFLLLALAGFAIWAVQNHVSFFAKKPQGDEESAEGG
jgi:flagellar basal body-associated protein FliL